MAICIAVLVRNKLHLSALDRLDARIVEVNNAVSGVETGSFSTRQWALDNRAFYNHGRVDVTKETNLGL